MTTSITLRPVRRDTKASNRFCGPAVLSALTGWDTSETARLLRQVSGRRFIKGTHSSHLIAAAAQMGLAIHPLDHFGSNPHFCPTLAQWSRARGNEGGLTYLLSVGHHWAVVQGRRYVCGLSGRIVPLKGCVKWRARVKQVWVVRRNGQTIAKPASVLPPKSAYRPDPAMREAKQLCAHYHISLESVDGFERLCPADDGVYVYPPADLYPDGEGDPLDGQRIGYSWVEVLENVRVYVEAINARTQPNEVNPLLRHPLHLC